MHYMQRGKNIVSGQCFVRPRPEPLRQRPQAWETETETTSFEAKTETVKNWSGDVNIPALNHVAI